MRLSEVESQRLDLVAKHYGLNAAGVIRMLLKREEDRVRTSEIGHAATDPEAVKEFRRGVDSLFKRVEDEVAKKRPKKK